MKTTRPYRFIKSLSVLCCIGMSLPGQEALAQYASSDAVQNTANCFPGMNNAMVLEVQIVTSGGASVLNALNFNTNGTTNVSDIESAKLFYSNGGNFTTPLQSGQQVGSTINSPNGAFSFSGLNINLTAGTNRFFLVYDLPYSAATGNSLDAELVSLVVDGNTETPATTAPTGVRPIDLNSAYNYCGYTAANPLNYQIGISRLEIGSSVITNQIAVAGTVQTITSPVLDMVKDYTYPMKYRGGTGNPQAEAIYIDFNNDGFYEVSERVFTGNTPASTETSGNLYINCGEENGLRRVRIATDLSGTPGACGPNGYGTAFEFFINITNAPAPVAAFNAPSTAYRGAFVDFENVSEGLGYQYSWDYEDDGNVDATSLDGRAQYNSVGTKTIRLTMNLTSCGVPLSDQTTRTVNIINPPGVPYSEFIANRNVTNQTLEVQFRDLSTNGANKWHWKITPEDVNGTPAYVYVNGTDSTSQHPVVLFLVLGNYNVEFYSENILGAGNYVSKPDYIRNIDINDFCALSGTSEESGFLADEGGVFSNYPNYAGTGKLCGFLIQPACASSISFNFLDFDMSSYQVTGCFIPGSNPQVLQPSDHIKVYDGTDNTGIPLHVAAGFPNGFTNGPNNSPLPQMPPTVTATSGAMFIEYSVNCAFNGRGFLGEWTSTPKILPTPVAQFEGPDTVYIDAPYIFTNTTTGSYDESYWDYDNDGLNDFNGTDAEIVFSSPGTQTVKLTAARCGNADEFTKDVTVLAPTAAPTADFTTSRTSVIVLDTIRLLDISSNGPTAWKWTISPSADIQFANGTNANSRNPFVRFNKTGMYEVKLWVSNSLGADSLVRTAYIGVYNYCIPNVVNLSGDVGISRVVFAGLDKQSDIGTSSYTRYADAARVEQGAYYTIRLDRISNFNNANYKVWIDLNKNGSFEDAGEEVWSHSATAQMSVTGTLRIPRNAPLGSTRMRIGVNAESNMNRACGPNQFGEFEDYNILIERDLTKPVITLIDAPIMYMEQGYAFNDPGATASDNADGDLSALIQTNTNLDVNLTGEYWISYHVTDTAGNKADSVIRKVVVQPDGSGPAITLTGGDTIYHEVLITWTDPGASALDFVDGVIATINVTGTVDENVLGTYYLTYSADDLQGNSNSVQRVVIVRDGTAPVLTLNSTSPLVVDYNVPFADPGVQVMDNYYTNVPYQTSGMVNTKIMGLTTLTYTASDPSGNMATPVTRDVEVRDISAPKITLLGSDTVILDVFDTYIETGVMIVDNHTKQIVPAITGTVNTKITGDYTITYTASDSTGNTASVERLVQVVDREAPTVVLKGSALISINRFDQVPDPGVILSDNYDSQSDLLNNLVIMDGVVTDVEGLYHYCYQVSDNAGNQSAQVCRLVQVGPADPNAVINPEAKITVYPNPSQGKFTVELPEGATAESVRIYSSTGALVLELDPGTEQAINIDLSQSAPGIYYVVVQSGQKSYSVKLSLLP